jgi:hypothetical protein
MGSLRYTPLDVPFIMSEAGTYEEKEHLVKVDPRR